MGMMIFIVLFIVAVADKLRRTGTMRASEIPTSRTLSVGASAFYVVTIVHIYKINMPANR